MNRFVFAIILLLSPTASAVELKPDCRIQNNPDPGYCAWACLETLGRHHGVKPLFNLMRNRMNGKDILAKGVDGKWYTYPKNLGYNAFIEGKLQELKVEYAFTTDVKDDSLLKNYANSHGCMVVIKTGKPISHAIIITEYNDKFVEFYDPNSYHFTVKADRVWFDAKWTGVACVIWK